MAYSSIQITLWLVASTSVSGCELVKCGCPFAVVHCTSYTYVHTFTEFADQQCHVLNSSGALLILAHAAIQVVYCRYMLTPFVEWLNFYTSV